MDATGVANCHSWALINMRNSVNFTPSNVDDKIFGYPQLLGFLYQNRLGRQLEEGEQNLSGCDLGVFSKAIQILYDLMDGYKGDYLQRTEGKEKRDVANGEERKSESGIGEGLKGETKLGNAVLGEEAVNANEDREERTPTTNAVFLNTFEDSDMGTSSPIYQPFGNLVIQTSAQAILCKIRILKDNSMLFCSIVYGMNSVGERKELWKELIHHANVCQREPWVIMGDFNAVRFAREKKGGSNKLNSQCEEFNYMCKEADIDDLNPIGSFFTWNNRGEVNRRIWCKLDRVICNEHWSSRFPNSFASFLTPVMSDHCQERVKFARDDLAQVQERLVVDPVDGALLQEEKLKVENMVKLSKAEESLAKQKSRVRWLREGKSIARWRKRNKIVSLEIGEDSVTSDQDRIKDEFMSFYSNLFEDKCAGVSYEGMEELITPVILEEEANSTISEVSKEEIQETMFGMSKDKAPGPDGYGAFFFKKAWDIVGHDVVKAIQNFIKSGKMLREVNCAIIALVPKNENPSASGDW
ncbi:uncharacterized protein LOC116144687 [Pistacia vera]|uniref:uncharacterized protein LOC116144687 n=1 Tax=Pistacia vera TaxID=55513 RepID=UPI001262B30F|nr:uncharacterized protein LOC116144687 [Pistacia vera]